MPQDIENFYPQVDFMLYTKIFLRSQHTCNHSNAQKTASKCSDAMCISTFFPPLICMHSAKIRYENGHEIHDMSNDRSDREIQKDYDTFMKQSLLGEFVVIRENLGSVLAREMWMFRGWLIGVRYPYCRPKRRLGRRRRKMLRVCHIQWMIYVPCTELC
jgi:hypothetical protein